MKFSTVTMAFMAAAGAAPGAFASNASASPSLRGYDHDNGSGSVGTPVRLLKPGMPELPPAALANGKGKGGPFDNAGACAGGWKVGEKY